jgi:ribosomal protein S18 acetylase RimI-like enzyme
MVATGKKSGVGLSEIDERRFGIKSARVDNLSLADIDPVEVFCQSNEVKFLAARCSTDAVQVAQALETRGYRLMDTLVYFKRNLAVNTLPPLNHDLTVIREARTDEALQVKAIAARAFRDYSAGHYHSDARLDPSKCDETYADWAYNSCASKCVADHVLVAEIQSDLAGFIAFSKHGEITLNAVDPSFQRKGVYTKLMCHALHILQPETTKAIISTQINNIAVQKVWVRLGFEPDYSFYTFHKWF